jgi:hypothetical protein
MPSSTYTTTEAPVNPLVPLAELVGWLASTTLHIAVGVLLGTIGGRLMRQHHLRWTWAVSALAIVALTHATFAGWNTMFDTTALFAAVRGRRWHNEDLMAGGDLAEIAAARRGPLAAIRTLSHKLVYRIGLPLGENACATSAWCLDAPTRERTYRSRSVRPVAVDTL